MLMSPAVFLYMLRVMCIIEFISIFGWMVTKFGPLVALGDFVFGVGVGSGSCARFSPVGRRSSPVLNLRNYQNVPTRILG